jgi:[histone H3]-lysine4 N-trimethyltransferase ASH1L
MLFDQNMIIDATTKGSIARFVNHSCNPNCRMEKWTVNGQPRMALFAGERGIMTGEELTYDYNFDPFSQKNVQQCRCGEPGCRGVLGPRPKKDERKSEEMEDEPKKEKGLKRKMAEALEDAVVKVTKKRKTETQVQVKAKSRVRSYSNISPKKTASVATKAKAAVKAVRGSTASPIKATSGLARNPSKIRKMMNGAKEKATSAKASAAAGIKKSRSGRRIISSTSATEALIEKEITKQQKTTTTTKLKSKVGSVKSNMVRTVRGRQSGHGRSMRVVGGDD